VWIRVMYAHPGHVDDGIIEAFGRGGKLVPYLDMPIQHASDVVLSAMGRGYDAAALERTIGRLRDARPEIALRTTVMVGHPGEGAKEFGELLRFLEKARFAHLGTFVYTPEAGTPSAGMKRSCGAKEAEQRRDEVMRLQQEATFEYLDGYVGGVVEIIAEDAETARAYFQAPEVDGAVVSDYAWPGGMSKALITARHGYDLKGEPI